MKTEEREVSLVHLSKYVAKGWKSILICMLIMATVVGGIQYLREVNNIKTLQSMQPATAEDQKKQAEINMEQLQLKMSEEEIKAVDKVFRLEKEYKQQLEYIQESLLMSMNPYNVSVARLQYWVNTDYQVNYSGITLKDFTSNIVDSYLNIVKNDSWRTSALKVIEAKIEPQYFSEMISVSDTGDSFTVVVKYTNQEQLHKISDVLVNELQNYQTDATKIFGEHKLILVNESFETTPDNDIYSFQQDRKSILLNLENNIANYKNAFNNNQKSLYSEEKIVKDSTSDVNDPYKLDALPTPNLNAKYILLGAILGVFLLCLIRLMIYILSHKLKEEDIINDCFGVKELGFIEEKKLEKPGFVGKIDMRLNEFARRSYCNLTKEQQLKMAVSNIALYCAKGDMKQIYLNSSINCIEEKAGQLVDMLKERGLTVKEGFSILQDATAMEDMSRADGVVFLEQVGKSRYEEISSEIKLCQAYGKIVIGLVILA